MFDFLKSEGGYRRHCLRRAALTTLVKLKNDVTTLFKVDKKYSSNFENGEMEVLGKNRIF
jgi:hypothetical protein